MRGKNEKGLVSEETLKAQIAERLRVDREDHCFGGFIFNKNGELTHFRTCKVEREAIRIHKA